MGRTVTVTFKVPSEVIEKLDALIASGVFSSRSEALRRALILLLRQYEGKAGEGEAPARRAGEAEEAEGGDSKAECGGA